MDGWITCEVSLKEFLVLTLLVWMSILGIEHFGDPHVQRTFDIRDADWDELTDLERIELHLCPRPDSLPQNAIPGLEEVLPPPPPPPPVLPQVPPPPVTYSNIPSVTTSQDGMDVGTSVNPKSKHMIVEEKLSSTGTMYRVKTFEARRRRGLDIPMPEFEDQWYSMKDIDKKVLITWLSNLNTNIPEDTAIVTKHSFYNTLVFTVNIRSCMTFRLKTHLGQEKVTLFNHSNRPKQVRTGREQNWT